MVGLLDSLVLMFKVEECRTVFLHLTKRSIEPHVKLGPKNIMLKFVLHEVLFS